MIIKVTREVAPYDVYPREKIRKAVLRKTFCLDMQKQTLNTKLMRFPYTLIIFKPFRNSIKGLMVER